MFVTTLVSLALAGEVAVCPGEGPRYGDFKCNHDGTHRVSATKTRLKKASKFKTLEFS